MNAMLALGALALQGALMIVDEFRYHRRRGLPRWERLGHPLDTLTVLTCYLMALIWDPSRGHLVVYGCAAAWSCLFVTKDEFLHAKLCDPAEHWLHALLFVLHPVVLASVALLWAQGAARAQLAIPVALTATLGVYQFIYWNIAERRGAVTPSAPPSAPSPTGPP